MLERRTVIVIVPAFNEEAHVARVVETMPSFVDHVIVVDDGSTDTTSIRAVEPGDRRVRVVRHASRRGVGAAIATGYREALALTKRRTDVLAVMAGDGQMDPNDLAPLVLPVVRGRVGYVKGNRFDAHGVIGTMGLPRWFGGQVFSRLTSAAVGRPISDSQCGYTALSRGAAAALDLEGLWPGFGYPNDLLGQLAARRIPIEEVDVRPVYGTEASKLRLRHLPAIFFLIARAALRRARSQPVGDVIQMDDDATVELREGPHVSS